MASKKKKQKCDYGMFMEETRNAELWIDNPGGEGQIRIVAMPPDMNSSLKQAAYIQYTKEMGIDRGDEDGSDTSLHDALANDPERFAKLTADQVARSIAGIYDDEGDEIEFFSSNCENYLRNRSRLVDRYPEIRIFLINPRDTKKKGTTKPTATNLSISSKESAMASPAEAG